MHKSGGRPAPFLSPMLHSLAGKEAAEETETGRLLNAE